MGSEQKALRLQGNLHLRSLETENTTHLRPLYRSHQVPLMPVPPCSGISYFDGPPVVSCVTFAMHQGKLTQAADAVAHPFWDHIRDHVAQKSGHMRREGFLGAALLPMEELE